jgi:Uncharacterized protein conserved in bacteria
MAEKKTILLRLDPKTWEEINRWADAEFRSVNGQIEYILHDAINRRKKGNKTKDNETSG